MIVRVNYPNGFGKSFEINLLKGDVKLSDKKGYDRVFALLPAEKTTFRIRTFPFDDKRKILKIVENEIKSNPLFAGRNLVFRSLFFRKDKDTTVFTVIADKKDIEEIKKLNVDSVDSEAVSLLRVVLLNKKDGNFYYEKDKGSVVISVRDGVPVSLKVGEKERKGEPIRFENFDEKVIPLFGSALQLVKNTELNFLKEESSDKDVLFIKSAVFLLLSFMVLSGVLFAGGTVFKREMKKIKSMEAKLFREKFPDIPPVDPVTQLKGMLSSVKAVKSDAVDIMNDIGKVRGGISIIKFTAGSGRFSVEGEASDISSVTSFAGRLKKFNVEITETVTLKDKVRFKLEGYY